MSVRHINSWTAQMHEIHQQIQSSNHHGLDSGSAYAQHLWSGLQDFVSAHANYAHAADSSNQKLQQKSLLRISQSLKHVGSMSDHEDHLSQMLSVLAQIMTQAFFDAAEPSVRALILSVIVKIHEVECSNDRIPSLKTAFESEFSSLFDLVLLPDSSEVDVVRLCSVIICTMDWGYGRIILSSFSARLYFYLSQLLTQLVSKVTSDEPRCRLTSSIEAQNRACIEVAKTLIKLISNFKTLEQAHETPCNPTEQVHANHGLERDIALQIFNAAQTVAFNTAENNLFVPENRFICCILLSWTLEIYGHPHLWVTDFFATSVSQMEKSMEFVIRGIYRFDFDSSSPECNFNICAFERSICTTISPTVLLTFVESGGSPLLGVIYSHVSFVIKHSVHEPGTRVVAFQALGSWLESVKFLLESIEATHPEREVVMSCMTRHVLEECFEHVFAFWEDPIDSVQHKLRDIFLHVLGILKLDKSLRLGIDEDEKLLDLMLDTLLKADWYRKVKYDLLSHILSIVEPERLFKTFPDFLSTCFTTLCDSSAMRSRICAFVIRFFTFLFQKDQSANTAAWLDAVISALTSPSFHLRRSVSDSIIVKLLEIHPPAFSHLLSALSASSSAWSLHGTMTVLSAGRSLGLVDGDLVVSISNSVACDTSFILHAVSHPDPNVRTDALAMICESHKSIAEPTQTELSLLKSFLIVNASVQSSEFRQKVGSCIGKFLVRVKRTIYANKRDLKARILFLEKKRNATGHQICIAEDEVHAKLETTLKLKRNWLCWLSEFIALGLQPGSSFFRLSFSLELMRIIKSTEELKVDSTFQSSAYDEPALLENALCSRALVANLLFDTFEPNRVASSALLRSFSNSQLNLLNDDAQRDELLKRGVALLGKIRTSDAESGCFIVRFMFQISVCKEHRFLKLSPDATNDLNMSPQADFVRQFLSLLSSRVETAEKDISHCAMYAPLHGTLIAIRYLLSEVRFIDVFKLGEENSWRTLLSLILDLSKRASHCVLPVLADESPEGHIPGSLSDDNDDNDDMQDLDSKGPKSQLILHECFRTMKEASSLIETVICAVLSSIPPSQAAFILPFESIKMSCKLLSEHLIHVRHRGAFSAVYTSFSTVCMKLMAYRTPEHMSLPLECLEEFLDLVESHQTSITRRSGGLPLGIVAILKCPFGSRMQTLKSTMTKLFSIAKQDAAQSVNIDIPQVHAFNIIRQLILDGETASMMHEFISEAFMLSINGFSSPSFPIRNCSTMLFAALINRSLGVKKSRDDLSIVNSVTGREFFSKHPQLHQFLANDLKRAVASLHLGGAVDPAFYPILTVLSRLKPYSLENQKSLLTLDIFRPLVSQCRSSGIYQVRELAAQAYASLLSPDNTMDEVQVLLSEIHAKLPENELHGILLQIQSVVSSFMFSEALKRSDGPAHGFINSLAQLSWLITSDVSAVNKRVLVELVCQIAKGMDKRLRRTFDPFLTACLSQLEETSRLQSAIGVQALRGKMAQLIISLMDPGASTANKTALFLRLLNDPAYEVQLQVPTYISSYSDTVKSCFEVGQLQAVMMRILFRSATVNEVLYQCCSAFVALNSDIKFPIQLDNDEQLDTTQVLERISDRLMKTQNTYLVESMLPLYSALLVQIYQETPSVSHIDLFLKTIQHWVGHMAEYVRAAVIEALQTVMGIEGISSVAGVDLMLKLDCLLTDDDSVIRDSAALVVSMLLGEQYAAVAERIRWPLLCKIATVAPPEKVFKYISELIKGPVIPSSVVDFEVKENDVLFSKEEQNSFKEDWVNISFGYHLLSRKTHRTGHDSWQQHLFAARVQLLEWAVHTADVLSSAASLSGVDLFFISGRPRVYALVLGALVVLRYGKETMGKTEFALNGGERAMELFGRLDLHPCLHELASCASSEQWKLLEIVSFY